MVSMPTSLAARNRPHLLTTNSEKKHQNVSCQMCRDNPTRIIKHFTIIFALMLSGLDIEGKI